MKERLVDDWLTRINERGYQTAFGQVLAAQGFSILRIGHSAYEHGKDVLAIAPNGEVHCYQLKDGDIDIAKFERDFGQISGLVQARPSHPSLPAGSDSSSQSGMGEAGLSPASNSRWSLVTPTLHRSFVGLLAYVTTRCARISPTLPRRRTW